MGGGDNFKTKWPNVSKILPRDMHEGGEGDKFSCLQGDAHLTREKMHGVAPLPNDSTNPTNREHVGLGAVLTDSSREGELTKETAVRRA
jgi:hypothetical protein